MLNSYTYHTSKWNRVNSRILLHIIRDSYIRIFLYTYTSIRVWNGICSYDNNNNNNNTLHHIDFIFSLFSNNYLPLARYKEKRTFLHFKTYLLLPFVLVHQSVPDAITRMKKKITGLLPYLSNISSFILVRCNSNVALIWDHAPHKSVYLKKCYFRDIMRRCCLLREKNI